MADILGAQTVRVLANDIPHAVDKARQYAALFAVPFVEVEIHVQGTFRLVNADDNLRINTFRKVLKLKPSRGLANQQAKIACAGGQNWVWVPEGGAPIEVLLRHEEGR